MPTQRALQAGFLAFHSNRSEQLAEVVVSWLRRHPLNGLEEDVILVQSNGMAEWIKMEIARIGGVCAATRVELPSRFLWRTYRQVLGREAVPGESALDKVPMVWRLMQLLPTLVAQPDFSPIAGFLQGDEPDRLLQLANRLADLFDQYQNYRADWLQAWSEGQDRVSLANGAHAPLPAEQRWQPSLWRAVLATLDAQQQQGIRPRLQQRMVAHLNAGTAPVSPVAPRVTVFGMSQIPLTTLQALAALSQHSQVMLAIPNPCQYYWGDIMEGRELLNAQRRRQPLRQGRELSALPLDAMHAHAHPLLAAWGRQGRDFIRQLDHFDDAEKARQQFELARIDLFDDTPETADTPWLQQVQNRIRDLIPLDEHPVCTLAAHDQSIVFHSAHSAVRELEVLHDQLLLLLAQGGTNANPAADAALNPRDIIVMVPDIERLAPAIRAVFGQYKRSDARYIPFDIADLSAKSDSPLIGAIDWLLRLPTQRCRMSELVDLLEVAAVASRFGIDADALPRLTHWMVGAGIRWGLNAAHRTDLGLGACGEQNSVWFGVRRMLLGFASGAMPVDNPLQALEDLEPYAEVAGLEAELAGGLAHLIQSLLEWSATARVPAPPPVWAERCRTLLGTLLRCSTETDKQALRALEVGLVRWQTACEQSGFDADIPLAVARTAWLDAVEAPSLNQRFRAGGVTFCTLMPMRAIPFDVVCLLGMNDGDYPRRGSRSDFDLMGLPGHSRPGDRARRDDDRQLMLEALLSARRAFYVSWCGRHVRDNSTQPPSVLVSQLRDYLSAAWGAAAVDARTTQHPLQPFSRAYFETGSPLVTYAREWRAAHESGTDTATETATEAATDATALPTSTASAPSAPTALRPAPEAIPPLTLVQLTQFLRNPVKAYFRQRLHVVFDETPEEDADDECFGIDGLHNYGLLQQLLASAITQPDAVHEQTCVRQALERLRKTGALPLHAFGAIEQQRLATTLATMLDAWRTQQNQYPVHAERQSIQREHDGVQLLDWIDGLRCSALATHPPQANPNTNTNPDGNVAWLELQPSNLLVKTRAGHVARPEKLLGAWVRSLAAAASGIGVQGILVGRDGVVTITPMPTDTAAATLTRLLQLWQEGMAAPLPLPLHTALAWLAGKDAVAAFEGSHMARAENEEACLARLFPDYATLVADGRFEALAEAIYTPLLAWSSTHTTAQAHASDAKAEAAEEGA